jgi:FAD/FMN-containing dehydrogenase
MSAAAWAEWERRLGAEGFAWDAGMAVARPGDVEETAAVVRWAGEEGIQMLVGRGGSNVGANAAGPVAGAPAAANGGDAHGAGVAAANGAGAVTSIAAAAPRRALRLDLCRMRRLRFYEPGDLTAGWDAGATAAEVNAALAAHGQFLPLDGGSGTTTLGAILAARRSGPLRHGFGTARDFVIGIEAVTAAGEIVHGGGKVVKNVAGYDLMRLLIGSAGTLAVITGVNCKVFPAPAATETTALVLADFAAAERLRSRLLHSPLRLIALELTGGTMDRRGPQHGGGAVGVEGSRVITALARFQGSETVRARYRRELAAIAAELGMDARAVEAEAEMWDNWDAERLPLAMGAPSGVAVELLRRTAEMAASGGRSLRFRGRLGLGAFGLALAPELTGDARAAWRREWRTMAAPVHGDAWLQDEAEPWDAAWRGMGQSAGHGQAQDVWRGAQDDGAAGGREPQREGDWMGRLKWHLDPRGLFGPAEAGA